MTAPVTVVSCVYGESHDRFIAEWQEAISALDPRPEQVIVASDRPRGVTVDSVCTWQHPQAFHLQKAISLATSEWVWIVDVDDLALPDALAGIEEIEADVWQLGYLRSDGVEHLPPQLTAAEYLELTGNPFAGTSMFRTAIFHAAGGFTDVAFQDWSLWRRLAMIGATFKASDRAHFRYRLHQASRTARELVPERRWEFLKEIDMGDVVAVA